MAQSWASIASSKNQQVQATTTTNNNSQQQQQQTAPVQFGSVNQPVQLLPSLPSLDRKEDTRMKKKHGY